MADTTPVALCHKCGQIAYRDDIRGRPICQHCDPTLTCFCPREVVAKTAPKRPLDELTALQVQTWRELEAHRFIGSGGTYQVTDVAIFDGGELLVVYAPVDPDTAEVGAPSYAVRLSEFLERFEVEDDA